MSYGSAVTPNAGWDFLPSYTFWTTEELKLGLTQCRIFKSVSLNLIRNISEKTNTIIQEIDFGKLATHFFPSTSIDFFLHVQF